MTILPSHVPYATETIDEEDEDEPGGLEPAEASTSDPSPASDPATACSEGALAANGAGQAAEAGALKDPVEGSGPRSQGIDADGPWVLLVTRAGIGKRVPVRNFPIQRRHGMGRSGIRLNPDDELAAVHVVRPALGCDTCKQCRPGVSCLGLPVNLLLFGVKRAGIVARAAGELRHAFFSPTLKSLSHGLPVP